MRLLYLATAALAAATALSCGGDDLVLPSEGEPAVITVLQGDSLSGRVGEVLAESLVVEVLDGADRPVPSATVVVELAGAVAEPDTLTTDQLGQASSQITLGSTVGDAAGTVRVIAPESPVEVEADFTVIAVASSANGIAGVDGDNQSGPVSTELPLALVVEVTDAFGNPIAGVTIIWTAEGGGSVSAPSTVTDGQGRTSVTRTLGPAAGPQTTLASSEEELAGSPVVFNHTATAGNPSGVQVVSGNEQIAAPGTTLPAPLVVAVSDQGGNPVVGAAVTWVVTAGGGSLDPTTTTTDAAGHASTTWTLGAAAGTNTAQAIVSGVGQAEFTARATAGTPSRIRIVSGNEQNGQAGAALAAQLVVQVLDDADNPVSEATVSWSVESGDGSVSPPSGPTDAEGRAAASWTLGPRTGTQRVQASVAGAGSVRFEATSTAGAAAALALRIQPSPTAQVGVPFNRQPELQVRDAAGNPVQAGNVTITAAITAGTGTPGGTTSVTTGGNGRATFGNLEINGAVGQHRLIFSANGLQSVTSDIIQVNPVGTTTSITSHLPNPSAPGQGVTVAFAVTSPGGTPAGTVAVTASGGLETCSAAVSAGQCVITLGGGDGNRTLSATFQGSATFLSSSDDVAHSVVTPDSPPTAVDDGFSATAGSQLNEPKPGVLANDSDVDGDRLGAQLLTGPSHGDLTLDEDGSFKYQATDAFFGEDIFTYRATAGGLSDDATVTIIVRLPGP